MRGANRENLTPIPRPPRMLRGSPPRQGGRSVVTNQDVGVTLARFTAPLARWCMYAAIAGLSGIVAVVAIQVFGRYVLNDTPVWAESAALVLVLYVTLIGAAVVVRDSGHIGMESLLVLVPERVRNRIEIVI